MAETKRLLLLGCTRQKRPEPELTPAVDRYDGPLFRILRKYQRENLIQSSEIDTYILSAKFGLLAANTLIPDYDLVMTKKQARSLQDKVVNDYKRLVSSNEYKDAFISFGKFYWHVFEGYEKVIKSTKQAYIATGSMGRRQSQLLSWLNEKDSNALRPGCQSTDSDEGQYDSSQKRSASLNGIEISATLDEIFNIARERLEKDQLNATNYQSWCVLVDETPVAPKWLVSQLAGISVGQFHTGSARRVLEQLGVCVRRA